MNFEALYFCNCIKEFSSFIPKQIHVGEFLGSWVLRKNVWIRICMYVCVYWLSHESIYHKKYLRLIIVYYVSCLQFLVHIRKQMEGCDVWFFSAFLGYHGYHGNSVNAVGFGTDWASILWGFSESLFMMLVVKHRFYNSAIPSAYIDIWLLNRAIFMLIWLIGYYFAQRIIMYYYNYMFYCSIFYEPCISKVP